MVGVAKHAKHAQCLLHRHRLLSGMVRPVDFNSAMTVHSLTNIYVCGFLYLGLLYKNHLVAVRV